MYGPTRYLVNKLLVWNYFPDQYNKFFFRNHLRKRFQILQRVYRKKFIKLGLTELKLGFLPKVVLAVF
jgi:hypothetical protein